MWSAFPRLRSTQFQQGVHSDAAIHLPGTNRDALSGQGQNGASPGGRGSTAGAWLDFATALGMAAGKVDVCCWLGLHGTQVASARCPLIHLAVGKAVHFWGTGMA